MFKTYKKSLTSTGCYLAFKAWDCIHDAICPSKHDAMCPSEHEAIICSSHTLPTSSETYPYPKGEHNGAVGPKYASC